MGFTIITDNVSENKFALSKDMLPVTTVEYDGQTDKKIYIWCFDMIRSKYCCVMLSGEIKVYDFDSFEKLKVELEDCIMNSDYERLCELDIIVR